jgi:hypothetical protein
MQTENITISITPELYRQFLRLKTSLQFADDQGLMQAAFQALERESQRGSSSFELNHHRYMRHPGLSPDDYDT